MPEYEILMPVLMFMTLVAFILLLYCEKLIKSHSKEVDYLNNKLKDYNKLKKD